jgi:hypothetical protein
MTQSIENTLELECGEKILKNLDKQLQSANHTHEKIGRLLTMRHFVSTQILQHAN